MAVSVTSKGQVPFWSDTCRMANNLRRTCADSPRHASVSWIHRAIRTLWLILDTTDRMWIPIEGSWRLNERHYGALQGLNKAQTVEKHGEAHAVQPRRPPWEL